MNDLYEQLVVQKVPKNIAKCAEEVLHAMNDKGQSISLVELRTNILTKKESHLGSLQESLTTLAILDAINAMEAKEYIRQDEIGLYELTTNGKVMVDGAL